MINAQRAVDINEPVNRHRLHSLKLLSFNIQTGVETSDFHEYLTKSWKHLLPLRERISNLNRIASLVENYDLVGLQEVDSVCFFFLDDTPRM